MMKTLLLIIFVLLAGCTSEEESRLIQRCSDDFYGQGIYNEETGQKLTPKSDTSLYLEVLGACRVKAELYIDGYRISPTIENNDLKIYLFKESSGLKSYYKKKLKCESNPDECGKGGIGSKLLLFVFLGVVIYLSIGFSKNIYSSSLKKGFDPFLSFILGAIGAISVPGSFVFMIWLGINHLKEQHTLVTMVWWILTCYSPYFIYTRLSRFVGYDIDSTN